MQSITLIECFYSHRNTLEKLIAIHTIEYIINNSAFELILVGLSDDFSSLDKFSLSFETLDYTSIASFRH